MEPLALLLPRMSSSREPPADNDESPRDAPLFFQVLVGAIDSAGLIAAAVLLHCELAVTADGCSFTTSDDESRLPAFSSSFKPTVAELETAVKVCPVIEILDWMMGDEKGILSLEITLGELAVSE
jgi:hypothetical protein